MPSASIKVERRCGIGERRGEFDRLHEESPKGAEETNSKNVYDNNI